MTAPRTRPDSGFTLVEALISLFVFGLIASGAVLILMQSVDTQNHVGAAQSALREVQTTRALLAGDLSQYVPREAREADGAVRPRLIGGDADTPLSFVRAVADPDPERGVQTRVALVEYDFENGRILRRTRTLIDAGADTLMSERVIVSEAGEPRFEFYDGVAWRETWLVGSQGAAPPRAVALVFQSPRYGEVRIEALVGLGA